MSGICQFGCHCLHSVCNAGHQDVVVLWPFKYVCVYLFINRCPGSFVRLSETEAGWSTWLGSGFMRQRITDTETGSMAPTSSERPWDRRNPWRYVSVASGQNQIENRLCSCLSLFPLHVPRPWLAPEFSVYITIFSFVCYIDHLLTLKWKVTHKSKHLSNHISHVVPLDVFRCVDVSVNACLSIANVSILQGTLSKMVWEIQLCLWWEERGVHPSRAFRTHWGSVHGITQWEVSFWC